jgi:hypothetical protein
VLSDDIAYKVEKLRQLAATIDWILSNWEAHTDKQFQALNLQHLRDQRKTLLATFPPTRLIVDNTRGRSSDTVLHFPRHHKRQG